MSCSADKRQLTRSHLDCACAHTHDQMRRNQCGDKQRMLTRVRWSQESMYGWNLSCFDREGRGSAHLDDPASPTSHQPCLLVSPILDDGGRVDRTSCVREHMPRRCARNTPPPVIAASSMSACVACTSEIARRPTCDAPLYHRNRATGGWQMCSAMM